MSITAFSHNQLEVGATCFFVIKILCFIPIERLMTRERRLVIYYFLAMKIAFLSLIILMAEDSPLVFDNVFIGF